MDLALQLKLFQHCSGKFDINKELKQNPVNNSFKINKIFGSDFKIDDIKKGVKGGLSGLS